LHRLSQVTICFIAIFFQGYVDASPRDVFKELVIDIESSPSWNPSLIECRVCMLTSLSCYLKPILLASVLKGVKISVAIILMCFIASLFIAALCK